MKSMLMNILAFGSLFLQLSCQPDSSVELKKALTFYVSFDNGTTADFALGDANMFTANASYVNSSRVLEEIQVGMNNVDHRIAQNKGRFGHAFEFGEKTNKVIYYNSKANIAYDPKSWSGTISFWLQVDPPTDLNGYSDPIQITDTNFNDASLWVDFTDDNPPAFRLGVIGDKNAWTQDTLQAPVSDVFDKRIVNVEKPPFTRNSWTHVLLTFEDLSTEKSIAHLYLNGEKMGTVDGIDDPFTWNLEESKIFLGLNYSGLMDEFSIFNKPLTGQQVIELYRLKGGIKSIL